MVKPRDTATSTKVEEVRPGETVRKIPPWNRLRNLDLKKDFETLKEAPINQPIAEFVEKSEKVMDDIEYDNNHELAEAINEWKQLMTKEYNKDLQVTRAFLKLKIIYERQIHKLMEFPDLGAEAIYEMYKMHNKLMAEK